MLGITAIAVPPLYSKVSPDRSVGEHICFTCRKKSKFVAELQILSAQESQKTPFLYLRIFLHYNYYTKYYDVCQEEILTGAHLALDPFIFL